MKLLIKLTGVAVSVIALIVFVALLSSLQAPPLDGNTPTKVEQAKENTPRMSTTTPPTKSTARVVVPLKASNPSASASSSISTPGPLIVPPKTSSPQTGSTQTGSTQTSSTPPAGVGALNQQDIILLTNNERVRVGLPALSFNATLSRIAEAKARDMIAKQYFAHVSPTGTTIADLSQQYGYLYRNIGENLALGDFVDSKDVVNGWMNSPGHRANILNTEFTEIGVAAITGNYNGRTVWYSVQEFGRPMPMCTMPDKVLEQKIEMYQSQITTTEATLLRLKQEIEAPNIDEETYRAKVSDYNTIVKLYNDLVGEVKSYISTYNAEVNAYNTCMNAG